MNWQVLGLVALMLGIVALVMQGTNPKGWLVGVACQLMWVPVFMAGNQWSALFNAAITLAICSVNYYRDPRRAPQFA